MKINSPCKDCTDRVLGCHSGCEKYKKFKDDTYIEYENKQKAVAERSQYMRYVTEQKMKRMRSHR